MLFSARKGTAKMRKTGRNHQEIHKTALFSCYTTTDRHLGSLFPTFYQNKNLKEMLDIMKGSRKRLPFMTDKSIYVTTTKFRYLGHYCAVGLSGFQSYRWKKWMFHKNNHIGCGEHLSYSQSNRLRSMKILWSSHKGQSIGW